MNVSISRTLSVRKDLIPKSSKLSKFKLKPLKVSLTKLSPDKCISIANGKEMFNSISPLSTSSSQPNHTSFNHSPATQRSLKPPNRKRKKTSKAANDNSYLISSDEFDDFGDLVNGLVHYYILKIN